MNFNFIKYCERSLIILQDFHCLVQRFWKLTNISTINLKLHLQQHSKIASINSLCIQLNPSIARFHFLFSRSAFNQIANPSPRFKPLHKFAFVRYQTTFNVHKAPYTSDPYSLCHLGNIESLHESCVSINNSARPHLYSIHVHSNFISAQLLLFPLCFATLYDKKRIDKS